MIYKKVLVTGGAGLVGLHTCNELIKRKINVKLFDLYEQINRIRPYINKNIEEYYGSILDCSSLRDAMVDCDAVIHLGAYLGVKRTETNKLRCIEINIMGTKNVLDCAIQEKIKKIVYASSSEIYGEPKKNPIDETFNPYGKTIYAISKLAGEELCKAYAQHYSEFKYTILRYFNTYGLFQTAQFVIPKFILNIKNNKPPIIYGNGKQKRSYCYVTDITWATVEALLNPKANNEIFNIGNDTAPINLIDLAEKIIKLSNSELKPVYKTNFIDTDRTEKREITERYCNIKKAHNILGYKPKISLDVGLKKVIENTVLFPKWASTDKRYSIDE